VEGCYYLGVRVKAALTIVGTATLLGVGDVWKRTGEVDELALTSAWLDECVSASAVALNHEFYVFDLWVRPGLKQWIGQSYTLSIDDKVDTEQRVKYLQYGLSRLIANVQKHVEESQS
jgi:hypothetical protein